MYSAAKFATEAELHLEALTFDDVLLQPAESAIPPHDADTRTKLTQNIELDPVISSAMDTVTEARLRCDGAGCGIGVIHKNLDIAEQAEEVRRVKRFEAGMVVNPITIHRTARSPMLWH